MKVSKQSLVGVNRSRCHKYIQHIGRLRQSASGRFYLLEILGAESSAAPESFHYFRKSFKHPVAVLTTFVMAYSTPYMEASMYFRVGLYEINNITHKTRNSIQPINWYKRRTRSSLAVSPSFTPV